MSDNPIFSYTQRDYESARKEGLAKLPILSKGHYTDLNSTDPGVILLDYVHALVDMIQYYMDHQALETFITTAKERSNIFRLAKQLAYEIKSAKGSLCDVTFISPLLYDHPIKIPEGTIVSTSNNIRYVTLKDTYLPKGESEVVVPCIQGKWMTREYTGTGLSRYSNEVGASDQILNLPQTTIDTSYITIKDNLGRVWSKVDYVLFSQRDDRAYQVDLNPDNTISIKFGDGERGRVPQTTDTLTIRYLVTDAANGKIGARSIIKLDTPVYDTDEFQSYIEFAVTNKYASTGGSDVQSSTEIREYAPGAIKTQGRAVTLSDFEILAKSVDGVLSAKAYDLNNDDSLSYHEVKVLIVPEDSLGSPETLVSQVYNYLYNRMIPPTALIVETPSTIEVNVDISVMSLPSVDKTSVEYSVRQSVIEYFNNRSGAVGEPFYPADLSAHVSNIPTVKYVTSLSPSLVVNVQNTSVVRLGTLTITVS